ncbi:curli-like amyloid fiber formation chaperone CsgH [Ensifer sp.]|uniref:curli-like amyloid fiber formation chaperone CsgH n=1 Tax=Ensifer sp. TaxID=1872086 RepID=UPI002E10DCF8|nr:curli-like amyloid fiber formation chaperone CsgH [Ensifer sp.]
MAARLLLIAAFVTSNDASATSMNGETLYGKINDPRVKSCGIRIDGADVAALKPFIEAADDLEGSFSLRIAKLSASGSSMTSQRNRFSAGSLGKTEIIVDRPGQLRLELTVTDDQGKVLCGLSSTVELAAPSTRI